MRLANCSTQSSFVRQDCFTRNPTMTTTYPFSVSSNNFEGKRVLVTGGTKEGRNGETMVWRFTPGTDSVRPCPRSCLAEKITTVDLQYLVRQ